MIIPKNLSKEDLIKWLITNKSELIEFKKSALKFADPCGSVNSPIAKSLNTSHKDDIASGVIKRTIIGNTYNWMDSHDDVHLKNAFEKSISERQTKIFHLHDHEQKITSKVGKPIAIYEKDIAWKDLGIEIEGGTQSLMMDSNIMKSYNAQVFDSYLNKEINQHSVGMMYVKIELAVNDPEMKQEYSAWSKNIGVIGNKEEAIKQGYFFAVSEAKLIEISAVLQGSNELTNTIENVPEKSYLEKLSTAIDKDRAVADLGLPNCDNCSMILASIPLDNKCPGCGQYIHRIPQKAFFTASLVEKISKLTEE